MRSPPRRVWGLLWGVPRFFASSSCRGDERRNVVELVYGLLVATRNQMSVGVDRDLDTVVSHLLLDVGDGFALLQKQTGERMPEAMKSHLPDSCLRHDPREDAIPEVVLTLSSVARITWLRSIQLPGSRFILSRSISSSGGLGGVQYKSGRH
jgi:hypothetical protein